jgi:hypothetical protein
VIMRIDGSKEVGLEIIIEKTSICCCLVIRIYDIGRNWNIKIANR